MGAILRELRESPQTVEEEQERAESPAPLQEGLRRAYGGPGGVGCLENRERRMARLNGLVTNSGQGVYWQLIDVGGPNVLTIAVSNQTPGSLKDLLTRATVPGFWPPEGSEYGFWTIDLDVMREHANIAMSSSSGFPPWVGGKVLVQPSVEEGVVRFDITPEMLA